MADADVVENAGPGAAGFRASEQAPTNNAAASAATGRDWKSFIVHLRIEVRSASQTQKRARRNLTGRLEAAVSAHF